MEALFFNETGVIGYYNMLCPYKLKKKKMEATFTQNCSLLLNITSFTVNCS